MKTKTFNICLLIVVKKFTKYILTKFMLKWNKRNILDKIQKWNKNAK